MKIKSLLARQILRLINTEVSLALCEDLKAIENKSFLKGDFLSRFQLILVNGKPLSGY